MNSIRPTPEVAPFVALIGERATLALLDAFGGTRIQVPVRVTERSALARAVGVDAARALSREFAGAKLCLPLAKRWRILHLRTGGASYSQIARRLSCQESTVRKVLADHGMTAQLALF